MGKTEESKPLAFIKNDAGGVQQGYWEDVFPTIRTEITPAIAQRECYSITPCDANGTRKDRPDGGLYVTPTDASKTLTHGNPNTETVVVEPDAPQVAFSKTARPTEAGGCPKYAETGVANTLNLWDQGETRANELVVVEPPVISLDGDKMGKAEREGGSGLGVNTEDVMYTQTAKDVHAVAYGERLSGADLYNGRETGEVAATLSANSCATCARGGPSVLKVDTVVDMMGGKTGCHISKEDVSPTLATSHGESHAVAYGASFDVNFGCPVERELAHTQTNGTCPGHHSGVVEEECVPIDMRNATRDAEKLDDMNRQGAGIGEDGAPAPTVTANPPGVGWRATVRRLLPVETERLMGFPDGWTQIPWKGKPPEECPDAPRYKACGNSMCVNVMNWIGLRIEAEERKIQEELANGRGEHQPEP